MEIEGSCNGNISPITGLNKGELRDSPKETTERAINFPKEI